jgi:peptidoglycan/xylan/chitin deacetylase (PgdA/CDA1 family)
MILMYHNISLAESENGLSVKNFEEHLQLLSSLKDYHVVSLSDYMKFETKNQIAITFDDAYECISQLVVPLIEKYQLPISVFIPSNYVGKYNEWDVEQGALKINIMSWEELKKLAQNPLITFGSHGANHISIGKKGENCFEEEFKNSKLEIESKLAIPIDYFAYPFGQIKDVVRYQGETFFEKWNYKAYLTTNWSRKNSKRNWYALNRMEITNQTTSRQLLKHITRAFDWRVCKQQIKSWLVRLNLK